MKGKISLIKDVLTLGLLAFIGIQLLSIRQELQGIRAEQVKNMYWVLPEQAKSAFATEKTGIARRRLESTM